MNIIDLLVIITVLFFGALGWRRGVIKTLVALVGIIVVFYLSFILKNPLAEWLSLNFPFFNFWGEFKGVTILNVIIYQFVAFYLVFLILLTGYILLVKLSSLFEKLLKATIILGIPSRILGLIAGLIEGMVISVIVLLVLSLPVLNVESVRNSKIRNGINNSILINKMAKDLNNSTNEILDLKDKFEDKSEFNIATFEVLLKHNIIDEEYSLKLINSGKLKIDQERAKAIINKYHKEG